MDKQDLIKTFGNVYLQDNHCWRDPNHQKMSFIFRIWIKNTSKGKSQLKKKKKNFKKKSKVDQKSNARLAPKRAIRHLESVNWHKCKPWLKSIWIKIKHILFDFLEIRMRPSLYYDHLANFSNIPASINRGCISKFNTLFNAL